MEDIFWLVVGGDGYILAGGRWRWVVGGDGHILYGGGWWWVVVGHGGSWWHSLVQPKEKHKIRK